jgi:hypothetical protein
VVCAFEVEGTAFSSITVSREVGIEETPRRRGKNGRASVGMTTKNLKLSSKTTSNRILFYLYGDFSSSSDPQNPRSVAFIYAQFQVAARPDDRKRLAGGA